MDKILGSSRAEDIFTISGYKQEFSALVKLLHPDVCHLPGADVAMSRLNSYRQDMGKYSEGTDDAGKFVLLSDTEVLFSGDPDLLHTSLENFRMLKGLKGDAASHFMKYLPDSMQFEDGGLRVRSGQRMIPLTHLTLPHEHTDWILSRIFELVSWLHQEGYCHLGIHPESIFVVPETHGIICVSFYHLTRIHQQPATLSGSYLNWYPAVVFDKKTAIPYIDLSLAQHTAIYLLGDKSGNGISLKASQNARLVDFLITPHYDSFHTYQTFRELLLTEFGKPTFHNLNI